MVSCFFDKVSTNITSNSRQSSLFKRICFWVTISVWLILAWLPISKQNNSLEVNWVVSKAQDNTRTSFENIFWLKEANAKEIYNSVPWKNTILNNIVREWSLYQTVVSQVNDVVDLDNWLFAIIERGNVICYVLANGEMFLNIYDHRTLDGMRDGTIQRLAWYKEIIISKDSLRTELHPKLFGYCWDICKTQYVLCVDSSKIKFALIEINTWKTITQDDKIAYFDAQYNIWRAYAMSQLSQIMSVQKWNKGFRINIPNLISTTMHFKIMRPIHLKELVENKRIDEGIYKILITKYFIKDWILQEMLWDPNYKRISTEFWDPITIEEIEYYTDLWWLDKKTSKKYKKMLVQNNLITQK